MRLRGPENLTMGGVVRPERGLHSAYFCSVSNICVMDCHQEARNEQTFVERILGLVLTDGGDIVPGNVGGER